MVEDKQLVAQYAAEGAEAAFTELVRRHLNMVYATALRQVNGDCHLAEDVAQNVFADLARKANQLTRAVSIAGWLYTSTRFAAAKAVRSESRRRAREEATRAMIDTNANAVDGPNDLQFLVDDALDQLAEKDREAIVLRYFELSDFSAVGDALGVSQNAARMRVERSLDKLRAILEKRGLTTTSAVLATALSEWAAKAAPAELARGVVRSALAQAATGGIGLSWMAKLAGTIKSQAVIAATLGILAAAIFVVRHANTRVPGGASIVARASSRSAALNPEEEAKGLEMPKGDAHALQRLLERHNVRAQAERARLIQAARDQWDKSLPEFSDWLKGKDGPGTKNFGARIRTTLASGETVVTGGWSSEPGKRTVALMTPTQIDSFGNPSPAGTRSGQIQLVCHLIEAPDAMLDSLGLQALKTLDKESAVIQQVQPAQVEAILRASTNTPGAGILSSPRVITADYDGAGVSVVNRQTIAGDEQELGLSVSMLPVQSAEDGSMDLGIMVRLTVPITAAPAQLNPEVEADAPTQPPQAALAPSENP